MTKLLQYDLFALRGIMGIGDIGARDTFVSFETGEEPYVAGPSNIELRSYEWSPGLLFRFLWRWNFKPVRVCLWLNEEPSLYNTPLHILETSIWLPTGDVAVSTEADIGAEQFDAQAHLQPGSYTVDVWASDEKNARRFNIIFRN